VNILSVDPGSARVGFSVLSGSEFSELKLLDWGVFNFDSSAKAMNSNMNEVLEKLYFEFISLIHDHVITHLACEVVPAVAYMASKTKVSATS
jgi:Holliday junction resolvasome RuvABC endonuclease subunit